MHNCILITTCSLVNKWVNVVNRYDGSITHSMQSTKVFLCVVVWGIHVDDSGQRHSLLILLFTFFVNVLSVKTGFNLFKMLHKN